MDNDLGRQSISAWAGAAPESAAGTSGDDAAAFTPAAQRFRVEQLIGRGGMGEVHLVTDEDLRRQIAMKVMREDAAQEREHRLSFVAEAQATSQLEHPGIPPVHDIGLTPDGRLYFTMKLVQGRTLAEVIHDLVLKRRDVQREYNLHKLVSNLETICETMYFAHERGVIHRDLKPENIMLGDYGEVHVMDWGLARVEVEIDEDVEGAAYVETARAGSGTETQHGQIKGTPPYMSPEQFRSDPSAVDERSDIYALGCLLYEMLTLHPAFGGNLSEIISKKMAGEAVDVRERNPRRKPPEPLAEVCRKAMAAAASERYGTAREMGDALRNWLDGRGARARRHLEAEALAAQGTEAVAEDTRLSTGGTEAERRADKEAGKVKPWQSVAEKDALLEARERVEGLETDAALSFSETTHLLNAALTQEAENTTARAALGDLWKSRLQDAEDRGDKADATHALATLRRYDD
ncbi:MAG: serine/threonine-protein kinase, partial [Planctomycetota bacterium]|nr:serine/threonine-protein kinase [Planctomycetota bacterium]